MKYLYIFCKFKFNIMKGAKNLMESGLNSSKLILGCVADDFTGASDIASFLELGGLKTLLINGIPKKDYVLPQDINAIVIALKSRNEPKEKAVKDSMLAFKWLKTSGVKQLFFKYCSTFDSNKYGNIGPVIDSVMDYYKIPYTIISPALPVNGRTVENGHLYVYGTPLNESSMKDHPLNPMWDSNIKELLSSQGKYPAYNINYKIIEKGIEYINNQVIDITDQTQDKPFYLIMDHFKDKHAENIVKTFGQHQFLTGSSGLAFELASYHSGKDPNSELIYKSTVEDSRGKIILAGSCSETTRKQIKHFIKKDGLSMRIDPVKLMEGSLSKDHFYEMIKENPDRDIIFYSTHLENGVFDQKSFGTTITSELIESIMADIAKFAIKEGYNKVIIAGGETSGAVAKALGFATYYIGPPVSSGVPILIPEANQKIRMVFKSGNFGEEDFFTKALNT